MYLKSIELSGFKSFAKKSELLFNSQVTSIVGPNGSGKSNVAEAFRFVLGEQSIKNLRGKKGEDLIFNGAGSEARANRASVKVVFDNSSRVFGIDFPEVTVERVVHRDGVNEYLINSSNVRLKDVLELLASAHIGASGHHIISQGEADKILNASSKDRKAIIEDALGLKIYQYKRIESERKLKKTFENIAQVESLRREIAPHLKFLRKQVEKVEKAESQKQELITLGKEYFKREDKYLAENRALQKDERAPIERELEKLSKESSEAKKILELESSLIEARRNKDSILREIGKIEGLIAADERAIENEKKLSRTDEFKTVRLQEVEGLLSDVSALKEIAEIIGRIRDFIRERKHAVDSRQMADVEARIQEMKVEKSKLEASLSSASHKEIEISDAEKSVFRTKALENELISKLNNIKSKEELLKKEEDDYRRSLDEVARLVGPDVLHFKMLEIKDEPDHRSKQDERKRAIEKLVVRLEDAGVSGGEEVTKEFSETLERDEFLSRELLDLEKSAESLRTLVKDLEERLATEFSTGIEKINKEFGTLFTKMFDGGDAHLTLVKEKKRKAEAILEGDEDADDESEGEEIIQEGLDIAVSLPRKKIRGLMMLSGGERALTSIALLFAISAVNPPPFIILDETDAALDEANSKRYGDMVSMLSKHSQLILITHNRETMSRAGMIYGVTMGSTGVSKLLSIAFEEAVQVAK